MAMKSADGDGENVEKVDLYNFEGPRFENSRYVLTSPRSLEACSRLNVKPVELLYKPLTEFQEELLPQDVPLRTIYNIYDEQEQIRLRKLHLCREERGRISKSEVPDMSGPQSRKAAQTAAGRNLTKESLQRQRTAWTVAATRMSNDKVNKRAKEVPEESDKLRQELLSRKDHRSRRPLSTRRPRSARSVPRNGQSARGASKVVRCKSASEIYSKLPARDQKILDLMTSKREEEQRQLQERERTRLLWEDEKNRQEVLRTVMENKRRKMLAQQNHTTSADKLRASQRHLNEEEKERNLKEYDFLSKAKLTDDALYKQLQSQELRMSERKNRESLRKSVQARNVQQQACDEEDMKQRVAELTLSSLGQAQQRKEVAIFHQSLRQSWNNKEVRVAFEQRRRELEKKAVRQEQGTVSLLELRHSQVEDNLAGLLETRNQQLLALRIQEEKKQEKARQTQQKQEQEMEAWRKRLLQHHKKVEKQAEVAVKVNINSRAERARQERLVHQQEQKRNLAKLSKEHDQWKRSLVESLHEKDKKVIELQQQKEQYISQTRSMAQMSQLMRDKVRMKYEQDTFDRKVLEAQMFAKLENRPVPKRVLQQA